MKQRKRIIVTVDTDLSDKQIEANGVTVYMPEPEACSNTWESLDMALRGLLA